jgi:hypothetical protein
MIVHPQDVACPECGGTVTETDLPERQYVGFTCEDCEWHETQKKDLPPGRAWAIVPMSITDKTKNQNR